MGEDNKCFVDLLGINHEVHRYNLPMRLILCTLSLTEELNVFLLCKETKQGSLARQTLAPFLSPLTLMMGVLFLPKLFFQAATPHH